MWAAFIALLNSPAKCVLPAPGYPKSIMTTGLFGVSFPIAIGITDFDPVEKR
jgi:hypothetical protein